MQCFKDSKGRTWDIDITVNVIKRVRALCQIDLAGLVSISHDRKLESDLLMQLANDPVLLVDVLFAVCQAQAAERKISDEEFGRAMIGDAIEDATRALLDEVVDFFPTIKREALRRILAASREIETAEREDLSRILEDGTFDAELRKLVGSMKSSSTMPPVSAE